MILIRWQFNAFEEMTKCGADMHDQISACRCRWRQRDRCDQPHILSINSMQLQHLKTNLILWGLFGIRSCERRTTKAMERRMASRTENVPHAHHASVLITPYKYNHT